MALTLQSCRILQTAIPMRSFQHASASRDCAEAILVRMEFADGSIGWGETLPRSYVTGETLDSVQNDIADALWPSWQGASIEPGSIESLDALPTPPSAPPGRNAARAALDLACTWRVLRDAPSKPPGRCKVSGVLGSTDAGKTARRLKLMRLFGLRDFKLKLGFGLQADEANLHVVHAQIGKATSRGRCTLRVDVNSAWPADETPRRIAELKRWNVIAVEQPCKAPAAELADLACRCELPIIADESLLTSDDAHALLHAGSKLWWNIRLSKNGGFAPSLRLARLAAEHGVPFILGCMVGETGILSALQRAMLTICPAPRFVEGNYGRFLLADDLTTPSPRFGYAGRLGAMRRMPTVREDKLARYAKLIADM